MKQRIFIGSSKEGLNVAKRVKVPIIGMGGIMNAADAIEFLIAGASAVAVGTANFINPMATIEIIDGINEYLDRHNIKSVSEIINSVKL